MPSPTLQPDVWRFAIVDVETSGLEVGRDQILQLAVVGVDLHRDGTIHTTEWSSMVRTRFPWDSVGPIHIHGIRRRSVMLAPPLGRVLTKFREKISGRIFTAHNAAFDSAFLLAAAQRSGQTLQLDPRLCTLELSRRLDPEKRLRHRLADIAERHEIPHDNPHDALEDARTTAAILPHLLTAHHITDLVDLQPHYLQPLTTAHQTR